MVSIMSMRFCTSAGSWRLFALIGAMVAGGLSSPVRADPVYAWIGRYAQEQTIAARIAPPPGYRRIPLPPDSFGFWLRGLPLKPPGARVHLYNGALKPRQDVHAAVIDLDVGRGDLQQCADAVIRLRAEYLFSAGAREKIHFNFTNGHRADFDRWAAGWRPNVSGSGVKWRLAARPDYSYAALRSFLDVVFLYAGTLSLAKELKPVKPEDIVEPGDVFVQGGSPGHAVIVLDAAQNAAGERVYLLGQSYMPAQEMHILKNLNDGLLSPWYRLNTQRVLLTPEWSFAPGSVRRFY